MINQGGAAGFRLVKLFILELKSTIWELFKSNSIYLIFTTLQVSDFKVFKYNCLNSNEIESRVRDIERCKDRIS